MIDFKSKLSGPLKEAATKHMDDAAVQLEKMLGKEGTEYRFLYWCEVTKT